MWGAFRPQYETGPGSDRFTSVTDWVICRRKSSRAAERGFSSRWKNFFGFLSKGGLAKCLYTHQESLTLSCRVSWACTERVNLCSRQIILLSKEGKKVKWSRYRPGVAQRVGRGIAVLFQDRGTRRVWVVSNTPRPHFTPGKNPVPILQEAGLAPGPVWTGGKSRPHRDSIPDRPGLSRYTDLATRPTSSASSWCYYKNNIDGVIPIVFGA